jgi:hypothetical protein
MITVQVRLPEEVVAAAAADAHEQGMEFDKYVAFRLIDVGSPFQAAGRKPLPVEEEVTASLFASRLFPFALMQQAEESGDDYHVAAVPYLIEELYKRNITGRPWSELSVGIRKGIGKAFKKLVDEQLNGGHEIEDGRQMRVEFIGRTNQNQAQYRTVRVG